MKKWQKAALAAGIAVMLTAAVIVGLRSYLDALPGNSDTFLNERYGVSVRGINNRQCNDLLNRKTTAQQVRKELRLDRWLDRLPEEYAKGESALDVSGLSQQALERKQTQLLSYCVAELYDCAANLLEQMGRMKEDALQEWKSRDKAQRTKEHKLLLGFALLEEVYAVEVEADHTVKAILDRYRSILEQWKADTEPIDYCWDTYCDLKTSLKMFFLDKYLG